MISVMRNPYAAHVDFSALSGLLPNKKAMPSNIDMIVERRGKFFIGEWKRAGEELSLGQHILLCALAKIPQMSVFIIEGHTHDTQMFISNYWEIDDTGSLIHLGSSLGEFMKMYCDWYDYADGVIND